MTRSVVLLCCLHAAVWPAEAGAFQSEPVSRWLPAAGEYRLAGEYGTGEAEWLEGVAAVAVASSGEVLVYDAASARIVVLSAGLRYVREFGREGRGPGELQRQTIFRWNPPPKHLLSLAGGEIAVYDAVTVHLFSVDGSFREIVSGFPRGEVAFWHVVGIAHAPEGVLYAIDTRGQQRRELQTWLAVGDGRRLLFSLPLAPLPPTGESHLQARPQWAVHGEHVYASDGENDVVVRYTMRSARLDTLALPDAGVPRRVSERAQLPRRASGQARPAARHTAERRWSGLVVDPDGFVWIAPVDRERQREGLAVVVVDPGSGRSSRIEAPAVPRAFGAPGVYYAAQAPAPEVVHVVRRYELAGRE